MAFEDAKDAFEIDQAVVPCRLGEDWALITRTKLPAEVQPPKKLGEHWEAGLSNGYTTFFLSPEHGQGNLLGRRAGSLIFDGNEPGSASTNGARDPRWPLPEPVGVRRGGQQHLVLWRPVDRQRSDQPIVLNSFVNYHFGGGWSVGSSPEITTNWIAGGGKWTVPVDGGFGKLIRLGAQPLRLDVGAYYNAIRPAAGNETWLLKAKLTFLFPE